MYASFLQRNRPVLNYFTTSMDRKRNCSADYLFYATKYFLRIYVLYQLQNYSKHIHNCLCQFILSDTQIGFGSSPLWFY